MEYRLLRNLMMSGVKGWDLRRAFDSGNVYTTATGTNPSSDIGIYNGGTKLFIFARGPTSYLLEYNILTPYDIATASFVGEKIIGTRNSTGFTIVNNGINFFQVSSDELSIFGGTFSAAYNVSTLGLVSPVYSVTGIDTISDIEFSPDGFLMFIVGFSATEGRDVIAKYTLSTPWSPATASLTQTTINYIDVSRSFQFKPNGLRLFIQAGDGSGVFQADLGSAWDLSTIGSFSIGYDNNPPATTSRGFHINEESGRYLYSLESASNDLKVYQTNM